MKLTFVTQTNSYFVNNKQVAKGSIFFRYVEDKVFINGYISSSALLSDITCDGEVFDTIDELKTWVDINLFSSGGGSGEGLRWTDASWQPVAGKLAVFSEQGLLSTGVPLFPENAVPLVLLDIRIPEPPATGNYRLRSVNGVVSWATE